jgi:hypothetical protein
VLGCDVAHGVRHVVGRAGVVGRNGRVTPAFRPSSTGLLAHTALSLVRDGDAEPPIARVIVGPGAHPDLAVSAAQQLLASEGYANSPEIVERSKIPLRV